MSTRPPVADAGKKLPPTAHPIILADIKVTLRAPLPLVFDALVNAEKVVAWWASDVRIEAELGGRYEGTLPEGRVEGTITAIDGPGKLAFTWPIAKEGGSIDTAVHYELAPKGPQTFVHLMHWSPVVVSGNWPEVWQRSIESLKAFFESESQGSS
jgi:uncharacterized protein YndB with AHSA1/START domain